MALQRVAVLGGGPGGLYAARLLALARPRCEVVVHEQGAPDETFGFGVGLAGRTQRHLEAADPASLRDVLAVSHAHDMRLHVDGQEAAMAVRNLVAVGRAELLAVLRRHAEDAGVKIEFGARRRAEELDADLVVAADGVGSATRGEGTAYGAEEEIGDGLYLWAGADVALDHALFAPVRTEHGTFVTHAYPYSPTRSTVLIETDDATWRAAGFDRTSARTPPDASDEESLAYLQDAFAPHLHGHRLIGNRTRWLRFRTVRCARWHQGRVVLLGDAAHTAHYSVGSGTKLAMEDAISLVGELTASEDDLDAALTRYTAARRPAVARLQAIAERSRRWWDTFPQRLGLPVDRLLVAYMSRAGNVGLDRFAASTPDVAAGALADYAAEGPGSPPDGVAPEDLAGWVLAQPLTWRDRVFAHRFVADDPARLGAVVCDLGADDRPAGHGAAVEAAVRAALDRAAAGSGVLWFTGADDRSSVLTRLEVAERARRATDALVVVAGPGTELPDLADALVGARTHLVALRRGNRP